MIALLLNALLWGFSFLSLLWFRLNLQNRLAFYSSTLILIDTLATLLEPFISTLLAKSLALLCKISALTIVVETMTPFMNVVLKTADSLFYLLPVLTVFEGVLTIVAIRKIGQVVVCRMLNFEKEELEESFGDRLPKIIILLVCLAFYVFVFYSLGVIGVQESGNKRILVVAVIVVVLLTTLITLLKENGVIIDSTLQVGLF